MQASDCSATFAICLGNQDPCPEVVCHLGECKVMQPCGRHNVCHADEYCCNSNCGICAKLDGDDDDSTCDPDATCYECGEVTCGVEEYCCDSGCGMMKCVPVRGSCLPIFCDPQGYEGDAAGDKNGTSSNPPGGGETRKLLRTRLPNTTTTAN